MADKDKQKDEAGHAADDKAEKDGPDKPSASAGRQDSAVPGVKRPPHTIDLKADEVKEEKASGKPGDEVKDKKPAGKASAASASESAAKTAGTAAGKGGARAATASGASAASPSASPAGRKEPPQRTTPGQVTGFVTHLAAGLLGGIVGVIGAGYFLPHVPGLGGVSQEYRQGVENRIATLESRLGTVEGSVASGAEQQNIEKRTADIEQRLLATERNWDALKDGSPAMRERIDRLDATLKAMEETAAKGGDVAQTAAIRSQVEEMTGAMDARVATLRSDLDALSQKLSSLPASGEGATAAQAAQLDALKGELDRLQAQARNAGEARGDSAALSIRLAALTRAVEAGKGYAAQLQALREIAPQGVDFGVLETWAVEGAPTRAELLRRFTAARKAALDAAPRAQSGGSLVDQFLDSASSLVRIRRVDGGGDGGPAAVLAEIEAKLREGNLEAAVARAEAEGLPDQSRQALEPWLDRVRARIALDAALSNVSDELARRLAAGGQSR